jgi:hypothetical protein
MRSRVLLTLFPILFGLIHAASPVRAQILCGSLTGNVTDRTGAAVPGAKIDAINIATGIARQAVSDEHGV